MRFNKGGIYPTGISEACVATIDDATGDDGRPWGSRIECHGKTAKDAEELRDLVLASLEGSVSRNTLMAVAKDVFAACEKEEGTIYGVDLSSIVDLHTSKAAIRHEEHDVLDGAIDATVAKVFELGQRYQRAADVPDRVACQAVEAELACLQLKQTRDVLMAFGEVVRDAIHEYNGVDISHAVDLSALADRYASKVQPEQVNQQLLVALKPFAADDLAGVSAVVDGKTVVIHCADYFQNARYAIATAEAAQPALVEVQITDAQIERHTLSAGDCPADSNVMLVSSILRLLARNERFLQPASAQPVAVPEFKPTIGTKPVNGNYFLCQCDKCGWLGSSEETNASIDYWHGDGDYSCPVCGTVDPEEVDSAAIVFNAMLSAAQKGGA